MIPETNPYNNWSGNGSSTTFDFDFYIEDATQLAVYRTGTDGVQTQLTYGTDYSINEFKNENGSYITFPLAGSSYDVLATGEVISLCLTLPISQENPFGKSSYLNLETLEYSLDYLTRICQIIQRELERAVKVQEGSDIDTDELIQDLVIVVNSIDNIDTVSDNIANVNTVAAGIADVIIVSEDKTNIDALANDLTNIDNVAADLTNIDAVAADLSNIDDVAADLTNINSVASDLTNIDTVSTNITNINSVNSNATNINSVASDLTNIDTVAADLTNINSVAGDLTNIGTVASNITNINAVNTNSTNINSVSSNLSAVSTVSSNIANVNTVSSDITDVNTVADNISIIGDLSSEIDYVNNSKALESGEVSSNPVIYNQILARKYSTFDLSKFTLLGNPTITDDGIMTETAVNNGVRVPIFDTTQSWEFGIEFTTGATIGGYQRIASHYSTNPWVPTSQIILINNDTVAINLSDGAREGNILFEYLTGDQLITSNTQYKVVISFNGTDSYTLDVYKSGELVKTRNVTSSTICNTSVPFFNIYSSNELFLGTIDLKRVYVNVDGVPVFTGTQGGTDEYTINGDSVSIPYTLSKTGSKIVASNYRTSLTTLYNAFGCTPYYSIDETNQNYTLPQGELYGMLNNKIDYKLPTSEQLTFLTNWVMPDLTAGYAISSGFVAPCDGWINANTGTTGRSDTLVNVNSTAVIGMYTDDSHNIALFFPISKGSTFNLQAGGLNWAVFYPCKGR